MDVEKKESQRASFHNTRKHEHCSNNLRRANSKNLYMTMNIVHMHHLTDCLDISRRRDMD